MSESTTVSSSTSTPVVPPEDLVTQGILNSIAGVAANYANTMFNWGQGVFNNLSGDISGIMGKLGQAADTALIGAQQAEGQFTGSFIPDYNALRTEAAQYANPARQARNAGMAESDQMQANQSAINDATQKLESMGIDTSGGRYAHDLLSSKTAGTAAAAGAGTQSIRADEATALGLKKEALDYGIQFPGIAANFLNQANQANSVSGNLDIGKTNAGANLMQLPNQYLNTAMQDRYPPSGQNSRSGTSSQSSRPDNSGSNSSGGGNRQVSANPPLFGGGGGSPSPSGFAGGNGNDGNNVPMPSWYRGPQTGFLYPPQGPQTGPENPPPDYNQFDNLSGPGINGNSQFNNEFLGGQTDPFSSIYGDSNTGYQQFGNYDPNAMYNDPYGGGNPISNDFTVNQGGWDTGPSQNYNDVIQNTDQSSFFDNAQTPYQSYDTGGGGNYGGYTDDSSMYGDFAAGGAIPDNATTGGFVPQSASPSGGRVTDDVHASVNADEFVVPKDVSLWKGQEFFQNLIAKSRKALAEAGARGQPAPAPQGPVRFASRPMGR